MKIRAMANDSREQHFIPRLKTMRLLNGWSIQRLAQEAGVDWDTIKKLEKNHGVLDYIAAKVHAAASANLLPEYKDGTKEIITKNSSRSGGK